jgi:hypothetical protein
MGLCAGVTPSAPVPNDGSTSVLAMIVSDSGLAAPTSAVIVFPMY